MTKDQLITRLRNSNRRAVARATKIPYGYINKLVYGEIDNPGHIRIDKLREYFISEDVKQH